MSRCKRFLSAFLAIILCIGVLPITSIAAGTNNGLDHFTKSNIYTDSVFTDVQESDWFYDNVKSVYEYALMRGKGDGIFDPENGVTLAETVTIAARLHAMYYIGMDVFGESDPWYQTYVDYAEDNGIVDEMIDDYTIPATRSEFADILANALPDSALEEINIVAYNGIPDVSLSDSYGRSVYKLYRAGIMIGNDDIGTFAPESNIRRCEVAAIVTRMVDPALRQSVQLGEEYTVSFDLGYWGLKLDDQKVVEGYTAEEPDEPTRQNYIFEGWYTAKTGGYKFEFETEILSDMTLYARWKMDPAWFAMIMNGIVNGAKDDDDEPEEPETPDEPDEPEDDYDYGSLPYRPEKTWEELTELNGGEEPYIELNDDDQVGLYIGRISDNKLEDVYDVIAELNNVRDLLNINDSRFEFIPCYEDGKIDENSYRVQQVHDGVQVWCAQVVVIVDDEGYIIGLTSSYEDSVRFSGCETEPDVTRAEAIDIAVNATEIDPEQETFTEATLVIEPEKGLVWYVTVANGNEKWWYWIDAANGDVV
ncbi:MAG: InlB B-repeat-containing protein, partial [Clostridia bacterium]|nr:InlB B-repeat-containing protein [Clostridia bacterium]